MGRSGLGNQAARRRAIEEGLISAPGPGVRHTDPIDSSVAYGAVPTAIEPRLTSVLEVAGLVIEGNAAEVLRFYNAVLRALDDVRLTGRRVFVSDPNRVEGLVIAGTWLSTSSPIVLHLADDGTLPARTISLFRAKQAEFLERYGY